MDLQPGKYFAIVRQIPDPNDATTYYVRAEVRNAEDDSLIERVELTDRGSGRHSKRWQIYPNVPEDGLYISILTTVYTDSGFTSKSPNYAEEMETYHVINRPTHFGGGGGGNISYERMETIFKDALKGRDKYSDKDLIEMLRQFVVKIEQDNLTRDKRMADIEVAIGAIPAVDLKPVLNAVAAIPKVDLNPVISAITAIKIPDAVNEAQLVENLRKEVIQGLIDAKTTDRKDLLPVLAKIAEMKAYVSGFGEIETLFKKMLEKMPGSINIESPVSVRDLIHKAKKHGL